MSERHPIVAITGSSGAGTSTVQRTFEEIFRRESVTAAVIEGDSFHAYDRKTMREKLAACDLDGNCQLSHFGPEANLFAGRSRTCSVAMPSPERASAASTCTASRRPSPGSRNPAPSPLGRSCPPAPT